MYITFPVALKNILISIKLHKLNIKYEKGTN